MASFESTTAEMMLCPACLERRREHGDNRRFIVGVVVQDACDRCTYRVSGDRGDKKSAIIEAAVGNVSQCTAPLTDAAPGHANQ